MSVFAKGPAAVREREKTSRAATEAAAPVGESSSGRRLGELLVEDGIITVEQLEAALRLQTVSKTYVPLGQVLLANKLVTRKQLNALLHRHKKRSRLGEILVKAGRITPGQLETALAHQKRTPMPLGQMLMRLGYVSETTMRHALCTQLHVNFFDIDPIVIDQKLTRLISERFAKRYLTVPLFQVDNVLVVAMDDPSQVTVLESLQAGLGLHIETVTTTTRKLEAAMLRLYGHATQPDLDVFSRRNILIGPIRDHVVVDLVGRGLRGVSVVPAGWQ